MSTTNEEKDMQADAHSTPMNSLLQLQTNSPVKPTGWGARHTLAFLGFWGFAISYAMRFNLSIAIVAMVNNTKSEAMTPQKIDNLTTLIHKEEACVHLKASPEDMANKVHDPHGQGEFHWDSVEQGLILGSFFWGYVVTQLPGGILATKYGGKWTLGLGLFVTAIFTLLTPLLARTHVYLLILARVIEGLGEGVTTPAMHAILAAWAPPDERSALASIVYAGAQFGTAVTMVVSGYLIDSGIMGGWPSIFYFIGAFSVVWFVLWIMFMHDTPASHPRISQDELIYIQKSIGNTNDTKDKNKSQVPTPWMEIFKSIHVWAIVVGHVGHAYGLYTLLTLLPTYLQTILHFDIKENSWISAFPYIAMWIIAICATQVCDRLISKKILTVRIVRVTAQSVAHIGSAFALIGASYSGCDRLLTVSLLALAVGINGIVYGGYTVNHVDISPNWAGILMGITNTIANLCGFAAPYIAGLLIKENPSVQNWQYVFFIAAGIYFVDIIFYGLFASGTEQPWNRPKSERSVALEEIVGTPKMQPHQSREINGLNNDSTSN